MPVSKPHAAFALAVALALGACEKSPSPDPTQSNQSATQNQSRADNHDHDHGHSHSDGPPVALGQSTAGAYTIRASRDAGPVTPGGEAAIDVWVTGAKPAAVRFWIGTEDARGSIKARAEIETPSDPDRWHTHAEIPVPLPPDSRLWVEIESESGERVTASFPLNP